LTRTATISSAATLLGGTVRLEGENNIGYIDGAILVEGSVCPAFSPKPVSIDGSDVMRGDYLPAEDDAYDIGSADDRWRLVRAVTVTQGDIGFTERCCHICKEPFKIGDTLGITVISLVDDRIETEQYTEVDADGNKAIKTREIVHHGYTKAVPIHAYHIDEMTNVKDSIQNLEKATGIRQPAQKSIAHRLDNIEERLKILEG